MSLTNFISILGAANSGDTYWIAFDRLYNTTQTALGSHGVAVDADDNVFISGMNSEQGAQSTNVFASIVKMDADGVRQSPIGGWYAAWSPSNTGTAAGISKIHYNASTDEISAGFRASVGNGWGIYNSLLSWYMRNFSASNLAYGGLSLSSGREDYDGATIGFYHNDGYCHDAVMHPSQDIMYGIGYSSGNLFIAATSQGIWGANSARLASSSVNHTSGLAIDADGANLYGSFALFSYFGGSAGQYRIGHVLESLATGGVQQHDGRYCIYPTANVSNYSFHNGFSSPHVGSDGYVYLASVFDGWGANGSFNSAQVFVSKLNPTTLSLVWRKRVVFPTRGNIGQAMQYCPNIVSDSQGNVYFHHHADTDQTKTYLTKLNSDGDLQWSLQCDTGFSWQQNVINGLGINSKGTPIWKVPYATIKLPPEGPSVIPNGTSYVLQQTNPSSATYTYTFNDYTSNISVDTSTTGFGIITSTTSTINGLANHPQTFNNENRRAQGFRAEGQPTLDEDVKVIP